MLEVLVPAWLAAVALAAGMTACFALGWRLERNRPRLAESEWSGMVGLALTLLSLMLAFTFSTALGQHSQRREQLVDDTNAIGDFYTCASFLDEPERSQLLAVVRRYAEHRLRLANQHPDDAGVTRELATIAEMQAVMQHWVGQAVARGGPVVIPLVNTLNGVTSHHAARLAAIRYRLPWSIVAVLFFGALSASLVAGMQQGARGHLLAVSTAVFIVLVSMVVWVILDLDQPTRGVITISEEPLERLIANMRR
jgi:hypothetical protein